MIIGEKLVLSFFGTQKDAPCCDGAIVTVEK